MAHNRDSSPVYYREIQKNAYLKRVPDEPGGSKLKPLVLKKPPLKPLWTQLCVHNGRTPYLEQYRDPTNARAHRPVWRASLLTARHVTASVTPRDGERDFLIDTDDGPVRMMAPDWDSMQDWVTTLRNKLHELKILPLCENVYCAPPTAWPWRAPARDPTSPLPPTPPVPPDRVPGIDLTPLIRSNPVPQPPTDLIPETQPQSQTNDAPPQDERPGGNDDTLSQNAQTGNDIIQTETTRSEIDVSSNTFTTDATNSSISDAMENVDISNWDPFSSLPSTSQLPKKSVAKICGQNICLDDSIFKRTSDDSDDEFVDIDSNSVATSDVSNYKQTVLVSDSKSKEAEYSTRDRPTNITVIKVSNKEPSHTPHTAIPVIGPETDVFDFEFKTTSDSTRDPNYVNIVNTEVNVQSSNEYGTVFSKNEPEYGHLSLTTTVSLAGDVKSDVNVKSNGIYERLCMASTSNDIKASPLSVRRLKSQEKLRKSSLPNLDTASSDSTYEYLFLSQNNNNTGNIINSSINIANNSTNVANNLTNITNSSTNISSTTTHINSTPTHTNSTPTHTNSTPSHINSTSNVTTISTNHTTNCTSSNVIERVHVNSVSINDMDSNTRGIGSNIVRTRSQNAYDLSPRREARREQNNSPIRNGKLEKSEQIQPKPMWKRGLTELSLLTRLRGIGQGKRQESPSRHCIEHERTAITSPDKVVHRSRPEMRVDTTRRRSSSLSNGQSPPSTSVPSALQPLRARQAALLRSEQRRGAALVAPVRRAEPPTFADYNKQVWIAWWGAGGARAAGRVGDRVCGVRAALPKDAARARALLQNAHTHTVDILFHRVPLGKIYVVTKRDQETIGIKLDSECNITSVEPDSPAAKAGIPPVGKWAVTEVNNRPINLVKGGEEDMNRLSLHGTEASVLIQPSALVKKLRAAVKGNKTLLGLR